MLQIALNEKTNARRSVVFKARNLANPDIGVTGATFAAAELLVSKNGGEANHSGTVTEIAGGLYHYQFAAAEVDTLGPLTLRIDKAGVRPWGEAVAYVGIPGECRGIVTTGGSTTSVPTSAMVPAGAVADQFVGRILIFDQNTTTAALRGQATNITASTAAAAPTFTVTALTTAPVSGDVFSVY